MLNKIKQLCRSKNPFSEGILCYIVTGTFSYTHYKTLGFTDGHLTQYEHFWKGPGYAILGIINTILLGFIIYNVVKNKPNEYIKVWFIIFWIGIALTQLISLNILEDGQGG